MRAVAEMFWISAYVTAVPTDHASVPVRRAMPVELSPSTAARSLASTSVGLPPAPLPLVMVMPAAGATIVRCAQVSAAVLTAMPVELSAAIAERSASKACTWLPIDTPSVARAVVASTSSSSVRA